MPKSILRVVLGLAALAAVASCAQAPVPTTADTLPVAATAPTLKALLNAAVADTFAYAKLGEL